jgi:hypothetical protein
LQPLFLTVYLLLFKAKLGDLSSSPAIAGMAFAESLGGGENLDPLQGEAER